MYETETAELRVHVTTALGAYPLEGASVTVSSVQNGERSQLYSVTTGPDGLTPPIILPTPPRSASLSPGGGQPFSLYTIEIAAEGFTPIAALNVPMFAGIPAMLPLALTPLPENAIRGETGVTAEGDPQTLTQPMLPERGGVNNA